MRLVLALLSALIVPVTAGDTIGRQEDSQLDAVEEIFQAERIVGTLVVAAADGEILHVYNDERSSVRFSPASTFKIPNTLIALDTEIVASKDSSFEWDRVDRGLPAWNRNHTLQSAFWVSCVWCYQEIARQVGKSRYTSALESLDYGNRQIGQDVDQFWLNDALQISAIEQIEFLRKLHNYSLPYRQEHIDIAKAIMRDEQPADYALYAKTGWTGSTLHVGWYVGFVEKGDDAWLFAMNMRMDNAEQAYLRKELTVRSLKALGIL